ncbi:C-factor-like [Hydractinia symbiolongicarpus]|uniref:C-factor-like n=1 Tax=Hydractinia symbiolongicarpus TaxID=13093 RepID=UPI00254C4DF5|nr:C-factor-like [Hydractinia symbiolongicarpus]
MFAKSILITGSNRGIGLELVKLLVDQCEHLFAACRSPQSATELNVFAAEKKNVVVLKLDVTDQSTIDSAKETVQTTVGKKGLNCLINNAGMADWGETSMEKVTAEVLRKIYEVNTIGPAMVIKTFLPLIKQASSQAADDSMSTDRASILNMSSQFGSIADNAMGKSHSYRMSKTALNMLTKNLSIELKPDRILAINLHPGWVQTEIGGEGALITPKKSAEKMLELAAKFTEKDNAMFYSWDGKVFPW